MKALLVTSLLATSFILNGCITAPVAQPSENETLSNPSVAEDVARAAGPSIPGSTAGQAKAEGTTPIIDVTEVPIPDASIYPLLVAEFALRARQFDDALERLFEQALILEDPQLARRALKLAEFRERDDLALALAMRLTALDATDALAASTAMSLLIKAGRPEQAIDYAREAKRRGSRINAPSLLANYDQLPDTRRSAIAAAIDGLAESFSDDNDIAVAVALVRREQGQLDASLDALAEVLRREPTEERALVLWSQIKINRGDKDAFEKLKQVLDDLPDAQGLRLQYARLLASQSLLDPAREQFHLLLTQAPRNGDYLFALALIEMEADNFQAAAEHFQDLIALGQRLDEAYYFLGRVAEEQLAIDAAIDAYTQVGPSREFIDAKRRMGHLLLDDGDRPRYAQAFNDTRQQYPGQAERVYMLEASLLGEREDFALAIDVYTKALAIFSQSFSLQYARAMTFEQLNDIAAAEQDLRAIIARDPSNATTLNALGYTLTVHTNRYAEAAELIERAHNISPDEAAILDSLGWVYFKLQRYDDASAYLQRAYRLLPDPEIAAHLGETLWTMGRVDDALAIWRDSLARQPNNPQVNDTMLRLGVMEEHGAPLKKAVNL